MLLDAGPKLSSQPQLAVLPYVPSIIQNSAAGPRPRTISLNSETKTLSTRSNATDLYIARWKISASGILDLLQNDSGLIKDVKHRFSFHKNVLVGSELVTYFVNQHICQNRQDAVDLGHHLLLDDILQHEYQEHVFKDKYLFYVISPSATRNAANIGASSDDSDLDFDALLDADESPKKTQNTTSRHSALAKHLIRRLSMAGKEDYLDDAALQDDVVAEAAADRFWAELLLTTRIFIFVPLLFLVSVFCAL